MGSIPGGGTKIPHASGRGQKKKKSPLDAGSNSYSLQMMELRREASNCSLCVKVLVIKSDSLTYYCRGEGGDFCVLHSFPTHAPSLAPHPEPPPSGWLSRAWQLREGSGSSKPAEVCRSSPRWPQYTPSQPHPLLNPHESQGIKYLAEIDTAGNSYLGGSCKSYLWGWEGLDQELEFLMQESKVWISDRFIKCLDKWLNKRVLQVSA